MNLLLIIAAFAGGAIIAALITLDELGPLPTHPDLEWAEFIARHPELTP